MRVLYSPVRKFVLFFYDADVEVEKVKVGEKGPVKVVLRGKKGKYELSPMKLRDALVAGIPLWLTLAFALWVAVAYLPLLLRLPLVVLAVSLVGYVVGFIGGFSYQKLKTLKASYLLFQIVITVVFFAVAMLWTVYPFNLYVVGVFSGLLSANAYFLIKGVKEGSLYVSRDGLIVTILSGGKE